MSSLAVEINFHNPFNNAPFHFNHTRTGSQTVCEDDTLEIACCPNYYIHVQSALYGREGGAGDTTCQEISLTTGCGDAAASLTILENRCQNKNKCSLAVNDANFNGDPCQNTPKYLRVSSICQDHSKSRYLLT